MYPDALAFDEKARRSSWRRAADKELGGVAVQADHRSARQGMALNGADRPSAANLKSADIARNVCAFPNLERAHKWHAKKPTR